MPTIAFLASGIEGIKVRLTVKAADDDTADKALDAEEAELRALLGEAVFGVDDETMEVAVGRLLLERGWSLGVAESLTGGLVAARVVGVPGASEWFRGAVVAYDSAVKRSVLGVGGRPGRDRARRRPPWPKVRGGSSAPTSVSRRPVSPARPSRRAGRSAPSSWASPCPGSAPEAVELRLPGDRERVRQLATISALERPAAPALRELGEDA